MADFDPRTIFQSAQVLESGTLDEKLELISNVDLSNPVSSGMLMRALEDAAPEVRLSAIQRLEAARIRPVDAVLQQLLDDEVAEIREIAYSLQDSPDTLNPLEQLIPMVESLADSLGPVGGMLRQMVGTMRDMGATDEKTQLRAVSQLEASNPSTPVAIHQALQSPHISVRIAALRKAATCPTVTIPEELISSFLNDPSPEVQAAAETLLNNGQVGPFDAATFREQAMQSMLSGALGQGAEGLDLSQFSDMFGGAPEPSEPEPIQDHCPPDDKAPGLDLGALAGMLGGGEGGPDLGALGKLLGGGEGLDMSALGDLFKDGAAGLDLSKIGELLGGGPSSSSPFAEPPTEPARPVPSKAAPPVSRVPHVVDGWIYIVGDERVRDRVKRSLAHVETHEEEPDCAQLIWSDAPPRWAISLLEPPEATPGWLEMMQSCGVELQAGTIALADQARRISEQVWGAAFGDHSLDSPLTLVFHDGMLSRAEWGGPQPGAWSAEEENIGPASNGPLALLRAFLADPTDDHLAVLPQAPASLFEVDEGTP